MPRRATAASSALPLRPIHEIEVGKLLAVGVRHDEGFLTFLEREAAGHVQYQSWLGGSSWECEYFTLSISMAFASSRASKGAFGRCERARLAIVRSNECWAERPRDLLAASAIATRRSACLYAHPSGRLVIFIVHRDLAFDHGVADRVAEP